MSDVSSVVPSRRTFGIVTIVLQPSVPVHFNSTLLLQFSNILLLNMFYITIRKPCSKESWRLSCLTLTQNYTPSSLELSNLLSGQQVVIYILSPCKLLSWFDARQVPMNDIIFSFVVYINTYAESYFG